MEAEKELYECCCGEVWQNFERVKTILANKNLDVNSTDHNYHIETALSNACKNDRTTEIIKLLLAHPKIEIEKADRHGNTPFQLACSWSNYGAIALLLKTGKVDIEKRYSDRTSVFWTACSFGHGQLIEYFLMHTNANFTAKCESSLVSGVHLHSNSQEPHVVMRG